MGRKMGMPYLDLPLAVWNFCCGVGREAGWEGAGGRARLAGWEARPRPQGRGWAFG